MLFNSFHFLVFLPLVAVLFFLIPHRFRWVLMLTASIYFYMCWKAVYILIVLLSSVVDYFCGYKMAGLPDKRSRRPYLVFSLISNLTILGVFKYYDFFASNINEVLHAAGLGSSVPLLGWVLPMGISFYTFQTMAYSIDVYRGEAKAEKHPGYFGMYVMYFPQLVAGPIERADHLISQFRTKVDFDYDRIAWGVRQMIWGFFKKVVIADRLGLLVDPVYNHPDQHGGPALIIATYAFAFQIYCDFSGYSDIAIGCSRIFGINLMDNFRTPYSSLSIREFWSRWHISLSTWFRDYLYIPLGGNKVGRNRWLFNLFIVFVVSGFWHGAEWTFIIWGALHGFFLIIENLFPSEKKERSVLSVWLRRIFIFHLVLLAWVFFRANSVSDAWYILSHFTSDFSLSTIKAFFGSTGVLGFSILLLIWLSFVVSDKWMDLRVKKNIHSSDWKDHLLYAFITALILVFGFFGEVQFIYFQF